MDEYVPKRNKNTITRYRMVEEFLEGQAASKPLKDYDMLSVVMICLGKPEEAEPQSTLRLLDTLFSSHIPTDNKKEILRSDFSITMTQKMAKEVEAMGSLAQDLIDKAMSDGRAEGKAEGLAEGLSKGMVEATLSSIRNLTETLHLSIEQAMDALRVPAGKREEYAKLLQSD